MSQSQRPPSDQIRIEIDNYEQNIFAIVSLGHIIEYDCKGEAFIAPSMLTSSSNVVSKSTSVTPDFRGEIQQYGIIGEIKRLFPMDKSRWEEDLQQLKKYDDDLTGWKGKIPNHDVAVITDYLRSYDLWDYITKMIEDGKIDKFDRNFSVLEFIRKQDHTVFFTIKRAYGEISNPELRAKLNPGVGIAMHNIIQKISRIRFYDSKPPIVYTMTIIWDHIFKSIPQEMEFRDAQGRKILSIDVDLKKVLDELRAHYCPQENPNVLEESWVKEALNTLSDIGLAKRNKTLKDRYSIKFHRLKDGKTTDFLLAKLYEGKNMKLDEYIES